MALKASHLVAGNIHSALLVEDLKRTQIVQYAGASGDFNPLHTDEIFAKEVAGFPTVFAHGMLTMGMTGKMLTDYVGDGRLSRFGVRFSSMVWPGDDLRASAILDKIEEIDGVKYANFEVITTNQDDVVVLKGYAQARVD
jgi:acyl dehydratase